MLEKDNSNDLQAILSQAISQMKSELGKKFDLDKINLAELNRRTGISRSKLRRFKENDFIIPPHALIGRTIEKQRH